MFITTAYDQSSSLRGNKTFEVKGWLKVIKDGH